ncbi:hypothetical protein ACFWW5_00735 [Streptomyces albidoflavus]
MNYLRNLSLRALVALQVFAAQEPVRLRAALTSLIMAGAFLFPAMTADAAERVAYVAAIVLPVLVGESARRQVTPADEDEEQ